MKIPIKLLNENAKIPTKGSDGAAGYDLYASQGIVIGKHGIVPTGVSVAIPKGHYGRIAPRSGLAAKMAVDVLGGVIDSDYRGEIRVILTCLNGIVINEGDRIAQLIIERCHDAEFVQFDELDSTDRGEKGFGSTDKPKEVPA
jgi:dUTP pyrophosphatase